MTEEMNNREEFVEINFKRLIDAVLQKSWTIFLVATICSAVILVGTIFFVTPQYEASAMFYINNSDISVGGASLSLTASDISASRGLVDTYIVILNTRETMNHVIDYAGVDLSYSQIRGMISAEAVEETEVFRVTVESPNPNEAEIIANAIAYILPKRISSIVEGTSAKVVDAAVLPTSPSSPSYTRNTMLGFALGLLMSVGVIVLREIIDITIRSDEDVKQVCSHPILAEVPDMSAPSKGGSYYYYGESGKKGTKKKGSAYGAAAKQPEKQREIIGPDISFAASEAYKLLRTKLQFSFADDNDCHVIALSSAMSGEGKSLTAVNLAYTLSQLDKKVILIDCDMRRPTLAEKLKIRKKPGLSSYLTGQSHLKDLIQGCNLKNNEWAFHVITAGQNPPNPVELLSSARMRRAVDKLREEYDYVILDMPPVGEVSDAMAVAKITDGILLIVRQNYCDRIMLKEAVRQFEFIHAKILGTVFNCTNDHGANYSGGYYKRYYRRYNKRYYKGYAKSYENNDRSVAAPARDGNAE